MHELTGKMAQIASDEIRNGAGVEGRQEAAELFLKAAVSSETRAEGSPTSQRQDCRHSADLAPCTVTLRVQKHLLPCFVNTKKALRARPIK